MPTTSETSTAARRHRLRTFGTLALAGPRDPAQEGQGAQRRRLALLAVLAAAGEAGRSRDQLLLLFWPDATQARARHSLEQLLYAIRSALDKQAFAGVNPLRLNPDVIGSDVADFTDSLERGELAAAVGHYNGPFLDGFYLSDAPEFEQWVAAERARLQRAYSGALEKLAGSAESAGDFAAAVNWWHRLSETDPVSSANAAGLMRALMNSGDHAAALRHAERHEAIVRQEVGASAGPVIAELVAEARAKSAARGTAPAKLARNAPAPEHSGDEPRPAPIAGVEPLPEAPAAAPSVRQWNRRLAPYALGAAAVLLVIAAAVGSRPSRNGSAPPAASERSIAVLPFANVSGKADDAPLVDGLTEELISVLSKIGNLRVIARTSAFAFKDSDAGVRRIADSLGVANILEGSVQRNGGQLRVQVRLVDARDGATRWSETFDRERSDVFAVQSEIARAVARELDLRLGAGTVARIERGSTANIAAYELYLRGSDRSLLRSDSAARTGLEYFRRATALDSTYAAAWAGLGRMQGRVASTSARPDRERLYALAEQFARKALALDDSLAEAHATLGTVLMSRFDFPGAERHLTRAIALDPGAAAPHEWIVTLYLWYERPAEALAHARRALELDPLSPYAHVEVARALLGSDRCDEALAHLAGLADLQPPLPRAVFLTALCHGRMQRWPQAIAVLRPQAGRSGAMGLGLLAYLQARAGMREEALGIERTLLERSRRGEAIAFEMALVRAGFSDFDGALAWLERGITDRSFAGVPGNPAHGAIMGPAFEDIRRHPGFARIRERIGLQKR